MAEANGLTLDSNNLWEMPQHNASMSVSVLGTDVDLDVSGRRRAYAEGLVPSISPFANEAMQDVHQEHVNEAQRYVAAVRGVLVNGQCDASALVQCKSYLKVALSRATDEGLEDCITRQIEEMTTLIRNQMFGIVGLNEFVEYINIIFPESPSSRLWVGLGDRRPVGVSTWKRPTKRVALLDSLTVDTSVKPPVVRPLIIDKEGNFGKCPDNLGAIGLYTFLKFPATEPDID